MSRTAAQLGRILALLPWAIAHPGAPVSDVRERFGYASTKDLLRDLDLVWVCGLPGYGPGELMEAYVEDDRVWVRMADYFSQAPRLTPAESLALLAAGKTVLASGQGDEHLESAVEKLTAALFPGEEGDRLVVEMDAEPELAATLRNAATTRRVVSIDYTNLARGEQTTREIEPWSVYASMGNWYVQAHCRRAGGERTFRLDRIRRWEVSDERFDRPDDVEPPADGYVPTDDDVVATIRLDRNAEWVTDYYPVEVVDRTPDAVVVRFSTYEPMVAAQLLLRLGGSAELVAGDEVESALSGLRRQLLTRYREDPSRG